MAPGRFVAINVGTAVSNNGMKPINAISSDDGGSPFFFQERNYLDEAKGDSRIVATGCN